MNKINLKKNIIGLNGKTFPTIFKGNFIICQSHTWALHLHHFRSPSPLQFLLWVPLLLARFMISSYVIIILCRFNYRVHVVFHMYTYEANPEWIVLNWTVSAEAPPWKKLFFSLRSYWPLVPLHVWAGPRGIFIVYNILSASIVIMLVLFRHHMLIFCGCIV